MQTEEKKVEYIELIYDLIFVYFIGRNNELLHHLDGGFLTAGTFFSYLIGILVILQIWYFSTLYINRYGDNTIRSFIGLFINMYLIYFMATGTRADWSDYYLRYNIAWGLILINLAVQYFLQLKKAQKERPWEIVFIKYHVLFLLIQAVIVFLSIPFYKIINFPLSWISLIAGFLMILLTKNVDSVLPVNFEHLTERVMLFVVFTFGEMIISIAVYFNEAFSFHTFYFSLMAFLIVAGLFLSYGYLYNHVVDRQMITTGAGYMLLHVVLLLALCNVTAALVYMREDEVAAVPKNVMLVISFLVYFAFLLLLGSFSKEGEQLQKKTLLALIASGVLFVVLMAVFYKNGYISIAVTVLFVFANHILLMLNHKRNEALKI